MSEDHHTIEVKIDRSVWIAWLVILFVCALAWAALIGGLIWIFSEVL